MPWLRDEVYWLIAVAKGDVPAAAKEREEAQAEYRALLNQWTEQMERAAPGDLSITHESVRHPVERAYRDYRQRQNQAAWWRLLQDGD